jgi:anti-anti-sigma factor
MMLADLRVERRDECVIVVIQGEIDISNAAEVQKFLAGAASNEVTAVLVDLSQLSHVDSAGLNVFFELGQRLAPRRHPLCLIVPPNVFIHRVLAFSRIDQVIPVFDGVETALSHLTGESSSSR